MRDLAHLDKPMAGEVLASILRGEIMRQRVGEPLVAHGELAQQARFSAPCAPSRMSMQSALQPGLKMRATAEMKKARVTAWM